MDLIQNLMYEYGIIAIFMIILLEYACFPVSSEIVLPFSGAVASINNTPFLIVLPVSIIAGMLGTTFCYGVGWFGGGAIINLIKQKFPKSVKPIEASYEKFNNNGAAMVCIGRVIPLVRTYIALIAGAAKLSPAAFFSASLLGITTWNTMLIGLGYTLRENYTKVAIYYSNYKHNLIPIIIIVVGLLIVTFAYKKNRRKEQ